MIIEADRLIDTLRPNLIKGIIPLHEYGAVEYIQAGLISREFVEFFKANPYGETNKYTWETHKVDSLQNLYIRRIS
jgi:hypothetical protein